MWFLTFPLAIGESAGATALLPDDPVKICEKTYTRLNFATVADEHKGCLNGLEKKLTNMKKDIFKGAMKKVSRLSYILTFIFFVLLSQNNARPLKAGDKGPPKVIFTCFANSFDFNAANPADYDCLQQVAAKLREYPDYWSVIDGHRDRLEDFGVSLERANNARDYLVNEMGIDASRIQVRSFCFNCPGDEKIGNRRIYVGIVPRASYLPDTFVFKECAKKHAARTCKEEPRVKTLLKRKPKPKIKN